jgi:hypothetical protein
MVQPTYGRAIGTASGKTAPISGEFADLATPFTRDERPTGLKFANCAFVEALRRSIQKRIQRGDAQKIAGFLGITIANVYRQLEGEQPLTVDVFFVALWVMSRDNARHVMKKLAHPLRLWVMPSPLETDEDSAA